MPFFSSLGVCWQLVAQTKYLFSSSHSFLNSLCCRSEQGGTLSLRANYLLTAMTQWVGEPTRLLGASPTPLAQLTPSFPWTSSLRPHRAPVLSVHPTPEASKWLRRGRSWSSPLMDHKQDKCWGGCRKLGMVYRCCH